MSKLIMYDLQCDACQHCFEALMKSNGATPWCPKCGSIAVSRQISPVRIDHKSMALSDSASPGSIARFDRIHREKKAIEEKRRAEHGD